MEIPWMKFSAGPFDKSVPTLHRHTHAHTHTHTHTHIHTHTIFSPQMTFMEKTGITRSRLESLSTQPRKPARNSRAMAGSVSPGLPAVQWAKLLMRRRRSIHVFPGRATSIPEPPCSLRGIPGWKLLKRNILQERDVYRGVF